MHSSKLNLSAQQSIARAVATISGFALRAPLRVGHRVSPRPRRLFRQPHHSTPAIRVARARPADPPCQRGPVPQVAALWRQPAVQRSPLGPALGSGARGLAPIFSSHWSTRPRTGQKGDIFRVRKRGSSLSRFRPPPCAFTHIETKTAPAMSNLWVEATTRGPLTWSR